MWWHNLLAGITTTLFLEFSSNFYVAISKFGKGNYFFFVRVGELQSKVNLRRIKGPLWGFYQLERNTMANPLQHNRTFSTNTRVARVMCTLTIWWVENHGKYSDSPDLSFLDALASLKTMIKIKWLINWCFQDFVTNCLISNSINSAIKHQRQVKSAHLAHFLGPIFGLLWSGLLHTILKHFFLGKPSRKKSAVFFNIVQKAFDPPALSFEHHVVNFFFRNFNKSA